MAFLVVTHGKGSLDIYSVKLSQQLPVPKIHTEVYQKISEQFGRSLWRPGTLKMALTVWKFVKTLHEMPGIPHLPNHHLGRFGYFLEKPFIITVHDLIRCLDMKSVTSTPLIHRPSLQDTLWLRLDYEGVKKAAKIIAPSHYTKRDIVKHLEIPEERIAVVYHGVDEAFQPGGEARPCPEPYVLYVGSEHPRKNLATLLKAFSLLKRDTRFKHLKLVKVGRIGGREGNFRKETTRLAAAYGVEKDVIFTRHWSSERELASYYSNAELFAFPSIYEGFGLPPLEALACGCPVVSSNVTSMPEILGDAAVYVNPFSPEDWANAMAEVLTDDHLRRSLSTRGLRQAKQFSWKKTAEQTLRVYREVEEEFELRLEPTPMLAEKPIQVPQTLRSETPAYSSKSR